MIDWARVQQLAEEIGVEDFGEVVALFLEEVAEAIDRLFAAGDNPVKIEEHMHFLKGAALNLGFEALARICQQGETEAATNAPPRVGAEDVQSCFTASREAFLRDLPARLAA